MRLAMLLVAAYGMILLAGCGNLLPTLDDIMLEPDPQITVTPGDLGREYEEIRVPVAEGRSVTIWYIPSLEPKALLVMIPGATANKSLYARLGIPLVKNTNYDLILMDYEGFGNSPGVATLRNTVDDALAVTRYAMGRHEKVVVFGISLGAPLAARVAADHKVSAVIMEGTVIYDDAIDYWASQNGWSADLLRMADNKLIDGRLPADYDVLHYVQRAHGAKLVLHAPTDTLTPFTSALKVYDAASPPKYLWQEYGDHGQMIRIEPNVYAGTIMSWLDRVLEDPSQQPLP